MRAIITYSGDRATARIYTPEAKRALKKLAKFMEPAELEQGFISPTRIAPGVYIQGHRKFGISRINIHVEPLGKPKMLPSAKTCFCTSCFAVGKIVEVFQSVDSPYCYYYDVAVCHYTVPGQVYALFTAVIAIDKGLYVAEQLVVLANMAVSGDIVQMCCPLLPADAAKDMCFFSKQNRLSGESFPVIIPVWIDGVREWDYVVS